MRLELNRRLALSVSVGVALALVNVYQVGAAPIAPLAGESLTGSSSSGNDLSCPSPTYSVSGTATGPYPGTFRETGTWSPIPSDFSATFSITSGTITVTGSKTFGPGVGFALSCGPIFPNATALLRSAPYTATIHTPSGDLHDQGVSDLNIAITPSGAATLTETFTSKLDADLALSQPPNLTVNATSPAGAVVAYALPTVTDEDASKPVPICTSASGSTFAIGMTTVTCMVTDSDDANGPVRTMFTVHVKGASEQLSDLTAAVQGVGVGTSMVDKVQKAQASLAAGHLADACGTLGAFIHEVRAQSGKSISDSQAHQLGATATRIRAVLGCGSA